MGSIVLLDEHTVNKIAAGEVVDRPASIVKELIENSIDAKATAITIEIKNGGIKYIKIVDNGVGFASDDVELAFERHATSKIRKEEDLLKITSMGFRGEALASIAAISKVTLLTKNVNEDTGRCVQVEAGNIISNNIAAATNGTKIEVRDVFYNVPARFKFLKKDYTEAGYIEDVVIRTALANPSISFKYINNSKTIIQTSGVGNVKNTIYDIFGKDIYNSVISINYEHNGISVEGMIGLPNISRSTRMHQFTFINSRYIKDKTISSAIDKACEQKYAINKFAFIVLNIHINPSHIDVNVHPAKLEVKFDDESAIFNAIYYAIRSTLEEHDRNTSPFTNIKKVENEDNIERISKDLVNNGVLKNETLLHTKKYDFGEIGNVSNNINNENNNVSNKNESIDYLKNNANKSNVDEINNKVKQEKQENQEYKIDTNTNNENSTLNINEEKSNEYVPVIQEEIKDNTHEGLAYKYVGQVFDTYIIIQINEKMYIIDQHAAHERLLYEQIKSAYYSKEKQTQMLLIPILVELVSKELQLVKENFEMFEKAGFILEEFGENAIKISGVPNIGYDIDYKSMFKDIIDELLGASKTQNSEKEFRFLATLACKAAVKGKMKLDEKEQIALIDEMVKLDNPFTCPHGRPTAYEISKYEIERRFLRK